MGNFGRKKELKIEVNQFYWKLPSGGAWTTAEDGTSWEDSIFFCVKNENVKTPGIESDFFYQL